MTEHQAQKVELKVAGMTCAMCARGIEGSLKSLDGVASAQVNLGAETALVEYDPARVRLADLEEMITYSGYQVIHDRAVLKIGGMTCAMCVKAVESALAKIEGVASAQVNLGAEQALVSYNPALTGPADFKAAIEEAGYQYLGQEGQVETDLEEEARGKDLRQKMTRVVVGLG
ncbi:MAG: heavy-metal-associated domain-containing protein, partial [Deltaproteobacteria bacterium]|nr:heavy-metal-associated domain-containing protein [Deltaproteobacteria bacterium]